MGQAVWNKHDDDDDDDDDDERCELTQRVLAEPGRQTILVQNRHHFLL